MDGNDGKTLNKFQINTKAADLPAMFSAQNAADQLN